MKPISKIKKLLKKYDQLEGEIDLIKVAEGEGYKVDLEVDKCPMPGLFFMKEKEGEYKKHICIDKDLIDYQKKIIFTQLFLKSILHITYLEYIKEVPEPVIDFTLITNMVETIGDQFGS